MNILNVKSIDIEFKSENILSNIDFKIENGLTVILAPNNTSGGVRCLNWINTGVSGYGGRILQHCLQPLLPCSLYGRYVRLLIGVVKCI